MIPAGGSGKLVAKVKTTANQNGASAKSITVHTDVQGAADLQLVLAFRVVSPIVALPNLALTLTGFEGDPLRASVVLHRTDGKRLELSNLSSTIQIPVTFDTRKVTKAEVENPQLEVQPGDVVLEVQAPPQPETTRKLGKVLASTNNPEMPSLEIPLAIWVRPLISVRPANLSLRLGATATAQRPAVVRLSSVNRRPFRVTGVEASRPDLMHIEIDSDVPQLYHVLRVTLAPDLDVSQVREITRARLEVSTSEPKKPTIEVPVVLVPAPEVRHGASPTRTPGA